MENCPIDTTLHNAKPVEAVSFIHHKSGHRAPVHIWAIPLRDKHGSIIGVIQTFEGEVAVKGPDPNDHSLRQRGWLDDATGLPNLAMTQSHLRETLGSFCDLQIPFGVICVEVRELVQLRARYGQEAATSMLQLLARTLRNTIWPTDFIGRWTEGRFLVILSGCGDDALRAVFSRMQRMTSNVSIVWWGEQLTVKIAIGITTAVTGDNLNSLMQRVQQGLGGTQAPQAAALAAVATSRSKS
jgi:diguanylate cyclase (GGDEF)-like protein